MILQNGDVIFIVDSKEVNISGLSVGFGGYSYFHCGIYIGDSQIIEAISRSGVVVSNIDLYHSNKKLVCRTTVNSEFTNDVIAYAKGFVGFEYNKLFLPNQHGKLYCSELIHRAYALANNADFFTVNKLSYISPNESEVSDYWMKFYSDLGLDIPHGEAGSHPNNLSLDDMFEHRFYL